MNDKMRRRQAVAARLGVGVVAVAAVSLAAVAPAVSSGFALRENSADGLGTAFAGAGSAAEDLSTIFDNPAGMTHLTGDQGQIVGTAILPSFHFTGSGSSVFGPTSGSGSAQAGRPVFVPALYALADLSPDLKLGLAVTSPFGLVTEYPDNWVGRYLGLKTELETVDVNPNVAYRVNDWISLGAGVSAQNLTADLSHAVNLVALPDAQVELRGDDWGWGYNAGVLLEPLPGTRVGITYRSEVAHKVTGNADSSIPALIPNTPFSASITLPASTTLSLTQPVTPQIELMSDVQWTQWSSIDSVTPETPSGSLPSLLFKFRDTWMVSLGAVYRPDDQWSLRAGVAYDESPVTDAYRTVQVPDTNRYILGVGIGYQVTSQFSVDASYAHLFLPNATMNSSVNNSVTTVVTNTITGNYQLSADLVSIALRLKF